MKVDTNGKGPHRFENIRKGFRMWLVCDKPMKVCEVDDQGEEHLVAIGVLTKEWRLRSDTAAVALDTAGKWVCSVHETVGEEIDNKPVEFTLPPPLNAAEEIRRLVREEVSQVAQNRGLESFDEAMDFEIDEDEWRSPYELQDMDEEFPNEVVDEAGGGAPPGGGARGADEAVPGPEPGSGASGGEPEGDSPGRGDSEAAQEVNRAPAR